MASRGQKMLDLLNLQLVNNRTDISNKQDGSKDEFDYADFFPDVTTYVADEVTVRTTMIEPIDTDTEVYYYDMDDTDNDKDHCPESTTSSSDDELIQTETANPENDNTAPTEEPKKGKKNTTSSSDDEVIQTETANPENDNTAPTEEPKKGKKSTTSSSDDEVIQTETANPENDNTAPTEEPKKGKKSTTSSSDDEVIQTETANPENDNTAPTEEPKKGKKSTTSSSDDEVIQTETANPENDNTAPTEEPKKGKKNTTSSSDDEVIQTETANPENDNTAPTEEPKKGKKSTTSSSDDEVIQTETANPENDNTVTVRTTMIEPIDTDTEVDDMDDTDNDKDYCPESTTSSSDDELIQTETANPENDNTAPTEEPKKGKTNTTSSSDDEVIQTETANPENDNTAPTEGPKKGKKRKLKKNEWRKNAAKRLRNLGQSYTSSSRSMRVYEKKVLGNTCNEKCRLKCSSKFTEVERQNILDEYWAMGDNDKQRHFILKCMESITPRYKREGSQRKENNAFYFCLNDQRLRVCKFFFMSTLAINSRPIRTVIEKRSTLTGASISSDFRGKHGNHQKIPESIKTGIKLYIESIPRMESHYCRSKTAREFIEGGRSLADIHRDYVEKCKQEEEPFGNYIMFSRIFNEEFNISFFSPKKDQCELCTRYKHSVGEDREKLIEQYESHILEKDLTRIEKEKDKQNSRKNTVVAVYDLQAVLPVPRGEISTFYYISKISLLNFTVHELKSSETHCYVWLENEGKRGANEIASCVLKYLESLKGKLRECNNEPLDVVFYSDNCCGQQKNRFVIAMYLYAVAKFDFISTITHKYFITGHSQNEGDNVHSVIEKQIKLALKSGPIFTPEQYTSLIKTAKKHGPPYKVHELTHDSFYDFKEFLSHLGQNFKYNENEESSPLQFSEIKIITVKKEAPCVFFYKLSFSDEEYEQVDLNRNIQSASNTKTLKTRKSSRISQESTTVTVGSIASLNLKKAYKTKLAISERKKKVLMDLVKKQTIPKFYSSFYENL